MKIDADAYLDFTWDWTKWMKAGDTIATFTFTDVDTGLSLDQTGHDDTTVTAWVTPGPIVSGSNRRKATCHIVTTQGREDDRTMVFDVTQL